MAELLYRFTHTMAEPFFKLDIVINNHHQGDVDTRGNDFFQTATKMRKYPLNIIELDNFG